MNKYFTMEGGDWRDYIHDVFELVYKFAPRSFLELGCGAFHAAKAFWALGDMKRYVGVDREPHFEIAQVFRGVFPDISISLLAGDVSTDMIPNLRMMGPYDGALIDAHDGPAEQYAKDHEAQAEIVDALGIPLVIVDDCRIESVAKVHLGRWGEPTGKGKGVTGLWWWKR